MASKSMEFKARIIFALKDAGKTLPAKVVKQLESQEKHTPPVVIKGTEVFYMSPYGRFIVMNDLYEDLPPWLRNLDHQVDVSKLEFSKNFGLELKVSSFNPTNNKSRPASEANIRANHWYTARQALRHINELSHMSNCKHCGDPITTASGELDVKESADICPRCKALRFT